LPPAATGNRVAQDDDDDEDGDDGPRKRSAWESGRNHHHDHDPSERETLHGVGERTSPKKKCCEKSKVPNISGWRGDSFGSLGRALLARPALLLPSSHNPQTMDATAAPTTPAERPTKKLSESSAYLAEVFISYLYYFNLFCFVFYIII
jgi:hypothetical protein